METHRGMIIPCGGFRQDPPRICDTLIAIALDMGPSAFRCPVCNTIYIVDPLQQGSLETEGVGFGVMEIEGHRVEMFADEKEKAVRANLWEAEEFYSAKVGELENVYVAEVCSAPGVGWDHNTAPQQMAGRGIEFLRAQASSNAPFVVPPKEPQSSNKGKHIMPGYTYRDYAKHIFDETVPAKKSREQVFANCDRLLEDYIGFAIRQFLANSGFANNLAYGKVEGIKKTIEASVSVGGHLYACVVNLNRKEIVRRQNLTLATLYNSYVLDDEASQRLLERYDVEPVIDRYRDWLFHSFLEKNSEFHGYAFQEVNFIRMTIFWAIRSSYLLCLVGCE